MDPSALQNMDRDALKKQIENMKYQASMERWPLSKSIAEMRSFIEENEKNDPLINAPDKKNNPWAEKGKCTQNRCSSQVSGRDESLDLVPVEMQHYNNNYYYYYNYNLSYEPPEDRSLGGGGKRGGRRLQQLVRRTRYELQQWPLLMQLLLFVLWLNAKFWQLVNEQVTYRRRRWH
ncbi:hypothetical protein KR084_004809 [Drosophila pseudotakahashii]|nr:hypothetical protein KR084_004809 [Drosophila pseudotakahashii]